MTTLQKDDNDNHKNYICKRDAKRVKLRNSGCKCNKEHAWMKCSMCGQHSPT